MNKLFHIKNEPKEQLYCDLLDEISNFSNQFALVYDMYYYQNFEIIGYNSPSQEFLDNLISKNSKIDIRNELSNFKISEKLVTEWPGTIKLSDEKYLIINYILNQETLSIIKNWTFSIYDWQLPYLPEDISFYNRINSEVNLFTITHEREAYLILSEQNVISEKLYNNLKLKLIE